jgi:NADPH:quinone reductase-like Zn-dependent oxidoreductase
VYQGSGATSVKPPYLAGVEGVGVIIEVGSDVTDLLEGQLVGWLTGGRSSRADAPAPIDLSRDRSSIPT